MYNPTVSNQEIAAVLEQIARLLEIQGANPFKVRAYQAGARFVDTYPDSLARLVRSGDGQALQDLPKIGESLAAVIEEYVKTGKSKLLKRLKGSVSPEDLFEEVPGIGKALASRIARELDVHSLEELEQAAHDGRLSKIAGFGRRRVDAIRATLAGLLSSFAQKRWQHIESKREKQENPLPTARELLDVDAEYRRRVASGTLKKIAPKRFNPRKEAWLPVLHLEKGDWAYTALFSNTARAHELGKTRDWVVIFFEKNGFEGQSTVVTETHGVLAGKRVVRGREQER